MPAASILVVDDEALLRMSLRARLAQEGYELFEAGTAADALEQLASEPDLVLLDFHLPDDDGLAVLRQIKQRSPDTIVILRTAFSSIENAVEAMKLGAFHYVNKPFDVEEIVLLAEKEAAQLLSTAIKFAIGSRHSAFRRPDGTVRDRPHAAGVVTARP
jgi:DNA-binding NtrC family response regulator